MAVVGSIAIIGGIPLAVSAIQASFRSGKDVGLARAAAVLVGLGVLGLGVQMLTPMFAER